MAEHQSRYDELVYLLKVKCELGISTFRQSKSWQIMLYDPDFAGMSQNPTVRESKVKHRIPRFVAMRRQLQTLISDANDDNVSKFRDY